MGAGAVGGAGPSRTSGIPPLEGTPQAPQIWIYPLIEQADNIIVNLIYGYSLD